MALNIHRTRLRIDPDKVNKDVVVLRYRGYTYQEEPVNSVPDELPIPLNTRIVVYRKRADKNPLAITKVGDQLNVYSVGERTVHLDTIGVGGGYNDLARHFTRSECNGFWIPPMLSRHLSGLHNTTSYSWRK